MPVPARGVTAPVARGEGDARGDEAMGEDRGEENEWSELRMARVVAAMALWTSVSKQDAAVSIAQNRAFWPIGPCLGFAAWFA